MAKFLGSTPNRLQLAVAMKLWRGKLPNRPSDELVRELYLVLKRTPAPGLPKRSSTNLRGF